MTFHAFRKIKLSDDIDGTMTGLDALNFPFGVDQFGDCISHPKPKLTLPDLNLPGIDGFEILRQNKPESLIRHIVIVNRTSLKVEGDQVISYDSGAKSNLVKPVSSDDLLSFVKGIYRYLLAPHSAPPLEEI